MERKKEEGAQVGVWEQSNSKFNLFRTENKEFYLIENSEVNQCRSVYIELGIKQNREKRTHFAQNSRTGKKLAPRPQRIRAELEYWERR